MYKNNIKKVLKIKNILLFFIPIIFIFSANQVKADTYHFDINYQKTYYGAATSFGQTTPEANISISGDFLLNPIIGYYSNKVFIGNQMTVKSKLNHAYCKGLDGNTNWCPPVVDMNTYYYDYKGETNNVSIAMGTQTNSTGFEYIYIHI